MSAPPPLEQGAIEFLPYRSKFNTQVTSTTTPEKCTENSSFAKETTSCPPVTQEETMLDVMMREANASAREKKRAIDRAERNDKSFGDLDLAIGINSLSECNRETQLGYFSNIVEKARYTYLVRNPDLPHRWDDHITTIGTLDDTFFVDDSERIEREYSSQIVVYIKKGE